MADATCRSCGAAVTADATTCPHCGTIDPVAAGTAGAATPPPERDPDLAARLSGVLKAIGCLVIALIVLGIAVLVGLFDLIF
jgi:hypothetical protein